MGPYLPYVDVGTNITVKQVTCGLSLTCVILNDNKGVKCWGSNSAGQLGLGIPTADNRGDEPNEMGDNLPLLNLGSNIAAVEIAAANEHNCIRFDNNLIKCFGKNNVGALGYGDNKNRGTSPTDMGDSLQFVDLGTNVTVSRLYSQSAAIHYCVILATPETVAQKMKCWGDNFNYQLGYGTQFGTNNRGDATNEMGDKLPVIDLGVESRVKSIGVAASSTCVITFDDEVKCWGSNSHGRLGIDSTASIVNTMTSLVVTKVDTDPNKKAAMIGGGLDHFCFLLDDYLSVKCVGHNWGAHLGQGDGSDRGNSPSTTADQLPPINFGTGSLKIKSIGTGHARTCVLYTDSSVKCIGWGGQGRLGYGSQNNVGFSPDDLGSNLPFVDLFSTFAPTLSPTPPTQSPTESPTNMPTSTPTKNPTSNPTRKPTSYGFFGPQESSLPGGSVKSFDLYLLIDTSRQYERNNIHCVKYKLMSGASPSSCFDLMMDYSIEIVKAISSSIVYYVDSAKDKGLRVAAYLISCLGSQRTPTSTLLFGLTGDSSIIMNALNTARTNSAILSKEYATCPLQGFYDIVQGLENNWDISDQRPYKAVITFTDGLVNDINANTGNALINVVAATRNRCTQSLVVVPFRYTTGSPQEIQQTLSLQILTGNTNVVGNTFEGKIAPWIGIPKIGEQIATLLLSNVVGNNKCSSSTSYSTSDTYWCGYNRPALCEARTSCEFIVGPGCRKKESMNGCVGYLNQPSCDADVDCEWKTTKCTRKPEEIDCNALVLQQSCLSRSTICDWTGSICKDKLIGPGR